jgi:hypothetical protein
LRLRSDYDQRGSVMSPQAHAVGCTISLETYQKQHLSTRQEHDRSITPKNDRERKQEEKTTRIQTAQNYMCLVLAGEWRKAPLFGKLTCKQSVIMHCRILPILLGRFKELRWQAIHLVRFVVPTQSVGSLPDGNQSCCWWSCPL